MSTDDTASPVISYLGPTLCLFATLLVVVPLVDFILNAWPPQFKSLAWRYAGEGLFSSSLPTLALGLFLINALALSGRKYRVLWRVIGWYLGFALLYLVFSVDFAFNAVQLRDTALSDQDVQFVFAVGAGKVVAKYLATGALQIMAAVATWRWLQDNPEPGVLQLGAKRPWWLFWWPEPASPPRRPR